MSRSHPFTDEDAAAWANVCYRLSLRWGRPTTTSVLHMTMDANWTDALLMWIFTRERLFISRYQFRITENALRALNNSRAFGLTHAREKHSAQLYKMIRDEQRLTG